MLDSASGQRPPSPVITRHAGDPRARLYHLTSFEELSRQLGVTSLSDQCLFADLSLGAWRGHWVASELAAQLGLEAPSPRQVRIFSDRAPRDTYAEVIGRLIDAEGGGDLNWAVASEFARAMIPRLRERAITHVLVAAPLPGLSWGLENLQLLRLLGFAAAQYGFELGILVASDRPLMSVEGLTIESVTSPSLRPSGGATHPVPGLVALGQLSVEDEAVAHLVLPSGRVFVSPNARRTPDGTTVRAVPEPALQAYFALHGGTTDVWWMQAQAGQRFSEGGYEVARTLLASIDRSGLSAEENAAIDTQLQGINIALMDFAAAADGPLALPGASDVAQAWLYQAKAWGLVMTGRPAEADHFFQRAMALLDPRAFPRLYYYLLNIAALAKLRLGDLDAALAIEESIERETAAAPTTDWYLAYINCLNLARTHKKRRDFDLAETYYRRAFYVTLSLRSPSDLLYVNLCFAQLETLKGRHDLSVGYWLRACLHWLANQMPEGLAPRVAQAVLEQPLGRCAIDVEAISAALERSLRGAAAAAGIRLGEAVALPILPMASAGRAALCLLGEGWSLFVARDAPDRPPVYDGPAWNALSRAVVAVAKALVPGLSLGSAGCLYVDDQAGVDLPAAPREALWSCLRWGVTALVHPAGCTELSADEEAVLGSLKVVRASAIRGFVEAPQGRLALFKRYLPPEPLSERDWEILRRLDCPRPMAELRADLELPADGFKEAVSQMFERRLVQVL